MGDPQGASTTFVPDDTHNRMRLARHEITLSDYWYLRGYRQYMDRDFEGAVESLNISLLHDPGRGEAHFTKGLCLQLQGLKEAETYPGFPEHVPARAHALLLKARWAFSIALEINPNDADTRTYIRGLEALIG